MKTARLGVDKDSNEFYLFDLQEACNMVQLLVSHACVTFGEAVYHQTKGIPMGINPAVLMANYYLFYYEYIFIKQLADIIQRTPPIHGGDMVARMLLEQHSDDSAPPWVSSHPENAAHNGNLAVYVLNAFRFTRRFVDDLIAACNQLLKYLLYTNNSILGGLIKGIYPHGS
jgi:hypothetical protein